MLSARIFYWVIAIAWILFFVSCTISLLTVLNQKKVKPKRKEAKPKEEVGYASPSRKAGVRGEEIAYTYIKNLLYENEYILANVVIEKDEKEAECDIVVLTTHGVFVFEIKNYSGYLAGQEEDYYWEQYKDGRYRKNYDKQLMNPIKQVRRQVYFLSDYLKKCGIKVWVDGFVVLLRENQTECISDYLIALEDINNIVHTPGRNYLSKKDVQHIYEALIKVSQREMDE
ncbi:MAG: NERD domain-containing protein [Erysipelotrichaceae bacterium]|nr:NERD domain-containing protein [Erysipelotrichaceae bacterium]